MSEAKDHSVDHKGREEWDRSWRAMPHRRLSFPPKVRLRSDPTGGRYGEPVAFTISQDPPEFCDRVWRESERCPICGERTVGEERLTASLHPTWANGLSIGVGVWVHRTCFERCPNAGEPAPIPW